MRETLRRPIGRAAVVAAVACGLAVASPLAAQACGCGGFVADQQVKVQQETAAVQLSPGHEVVSMQFAADTTATKAAWVMPVPKRASMELGDQALFDQLDKLTAPEVRVVDVEEDGDGSGAGAASPTGAPSVTVTDRVTLGPYDVAQLSGSDPSAVAKWLTEHGFKLSDKLAGGLATYLAEGWQVIAVRLSGTGTHSLGGVMPPLRVSFDATEPVYPMRLSALATTPQALRVYVLAEHKMQATSPAPADGELTLAFAGSNDQARYPAVPSTAGKAAFVTRYDGQWTTPAEITADITFSQAPTDDPYREVVTERHVVHRSTQEATANGSSGGDGDWWRSSTALALGIGVIVLALASTATGVVMLTRRRSR